MATTGWHIHTHQHKHHHMHAITQSMPWLAGWLAGNNQKLISEAPINFQFAYLNFHTRRHNELSPSLSFSCVFFPSASSLFWVHKNVIFVFLLLAMWLLLLPLFPLHRLTVFLWVALELSEFLCLPNILCKQLANIFNLETTTKRQTVAGAEAGMKLANQS